MFTLLLLCLGWLNAQESFQIIVHPGVNIESIQKGTLKNIFLGKKTKWDDGQKIKPVMMKDGEARVMFISQIIEKSDYAFDNYWRQRIYTGKGVPPVQFVHEKDIIEYIKNTPGAIGYIPLEALGLLGNDLRRLEIEE